MFLNHIAYYTIARSTILTVTGRFLTIVVSALYFFIVSKHLLNLKKKRFYTLERFRFMSRRKFENGFRFLSKVRLKLHVSSCPSIIHIHSVLRSLKLFILKTHAFIRINIYTYATRIFSELNYIVLAYKTYIIFVNSHVIIHIYKYIYTRTIRERTNGVRVRVVVANFS